MPETVVVLNTSEEVIALMAEALELEGFQVVTDDIVPPRRGGCPQGEGPGRVFCDPSTAGGGL